MNQHQYTDLGLISYDLSNSSSTVQYLELLRQLTQHRPFNQYVVFNSYSEVVDTLCVPILHVSQAKFFYGDILVCDMPSLLLAIECVNTSNIYYYCNHIPWEQNIRDYSYWQKIFTNNSLNIIAKDQKIYDIFELLWKKPIATIKDLNYESINNII